MTRGITAIIKPTHECNLACRYCYVEENAEQGRMDSRTLTTILQQLTNLAGDHEVHVIWHGGEPLLMGLDFFEEVARISNHLREKDYQISNGIQSNATLVTEDLLDFVEKENDFRLGFSLDGPEEINNRTRIYPNGRGAFDDIFSGIKKVRERKEGKEERSSFGGGVITVLSRANMKDILQIYDFFKGERINIKINPIVNSGGAIKEEELKISPKEYADAMISLFDKWIDDYESIDIDPFTLIMGNFMTERPLGCNYSVSCRDNFVSIGPQGDIYPCGRFDGVKEFWMGDINGKNGLEGALNSEVQRRLSERRIDTVKGCKDCEYGKICNAGCMHNALTIGDVIGKDPYCIGYKKIFNHIQGKLHEELSLAEVK